MDTKLRINRLDLSNAFITRDKGFYADLKDKEKEKKKKNSKKKSNKDCYKSIFENFHSIDLLS
jgi:hypothetical protein